MASYTDWVDPFIGTHGMGNCLVGPYLPLSLVRLGPDTLRPQPTSGYDHRQPIVGFSHTHVSGTGGQSRYGNIRVMPFPGPPRLIFDPPYATQEQARAGYYSVVLDPTIIRVELTSTPRVGMHRYHFPAQPAATALEDDDSGVASIATYDPSARIEPVHRDGINLLIDVGAVIQRDLRDPVREAGGSIGGYVEFISETEVVGRGDFAGGWGHAFPYSVYFYARLDQPADVRLVANHAGIGQGTSMYGPNCSAIAHYRGSEARTLELKVGISFVSVAKARASVDREAGRAFAVVRDEADATWNRALERIHVEGGSNDHRKLFYSLFTRLICMPSDLGVDDEFPQWHSGVRHFNDYYCLWDSVRNANSLITLFDPQLEVDMLNCLLDVAEHTGWLVDAWIAGHSAKVQGGSSADVLFNEAKLKGLEGIDYDKALQFMRKNAEVRSPDPKLFGRYLGHYDTQGYVSTDTINCVSRHLEYSYQDWCIASLARQLGHHDLAAQYQQASAKLWNLWREDLRFFGPKKPDGTWVGSFDPAYQRPDAWNDPYFYEGNSWQWTWNTQHDFAGLVERMGGSEAFIERLDRFFDEGFFYAKETMLHVPYLYLYAGRPDRTVDRVREALARFFRPVRQGLVDNEDMGSHSAFFMASAIGVYPLMGQDLYWLTTPLFEKVVVQLGATGRTLTIEAPGTNDTCRYIQSATLNGQPLDRAWLRHSDLSDGAVLRYELADAPGSWGTQSPPASAKP